MFILKKLYLTLLIIILLILATGTIVSKSMGQDAAETFIYSSPFFVFLWVLFAAISLFIIFKKHLFKRPVTFLLHLSFILIFAGAITTWLNGKRGYISLKKSDYSDIYFSAEGETEKLPFKITVESFSIEKYPGSDAPMDYVSNITIDDKGETVKGIVSMNNILKYRNFRFYQNGIDESSDEVGLLVSYDPVGIGITYAGYLLFIVSFIFFFFTRRSDFNKLLKALQNKRIYLLIPFMVFPAIFKGQSEPKVLPQKLADEFCEMRILYNNRVMPLQTLAKDFTIKLYGKNNFNGYSAEQVLTGWLFFPANWKEQPVIKIKDGKIRRILGIEDKYASYNDFITPTNVYKLTQEKKNIPLKTYYEADEKFNLIRSICSGKLFKIFPHHNQENNTLNWYSAGDILPGEISDEKWFFIKKSTDYLHENIILKDYENASFIIEKIKVYQEKENTSFGFVFKNLKVEKFYNKFCNYLLISILLICCGILYLIFFIRDIFKRSSDNLKSYHSFFVFLSILSIIYISLMISLRWYLSGHIPMSNGFETMQFLAWCILIISLLLSSQQRFIFIAGFLLSGFILLVAFISERSPQITPLMPVLSSPLLCFHVSLIMLSYSLLAIIMINSVFAIIINILNIGMNSFYYLNKLFILNKILLYPALLFLGSGIIVGAVWANVSWGRYWGWDPKEIWAFITFIIYSFALHSRSLKSFEKPMYFHYFSVLAFLSVLMTYFGVNYLLGGLHSYA